MKKLTKLTIVTLTAMSLTACGSTSEPAIESTKPETEVASVNDTAAEISEETVTEETKDYEISKEDLVIDREVNEVIVAPVEDEVLEPEVIPMDEVKSVEEAKTSEENSTNVTDPNEPTVWNRGITISEFFDKAEEYYSQFPEFEGKFEYQEIDNGRKLAIDKDSEYASLYIYTYDYSHRYMDRFNDITDLIYTSDDHLTVSYYSNSTNCYGFYLADEKGCIIYCDVRDYETAKENAEKYLKTKFE